MFSVADLRQLQFPAELRIVDAVWTDELAELLRDCLAKVETATPLTAESSSSEHSEESVRFLADVGTGLWRLRQRMVEPGTDRPLEEMRRAYRHLQSTWDALANAGLDIIDHTGQPFDPGLSIKVLAYQPTPDVTKDRVLETVKPTIYFRQTRLQMGEIIVATVDEKGALT